MTWARRAFSLSIDDAAVSLGISGEELALLESGELPVPGDVFRGMQELYRQPESVLLLPSPPPDREIEDFRIVGNTSPALTEELKLRIRDAHRIQAIVSELLDIEPDLFPHLRLPRADERGDAASAESVAEEFRQLIGIPISGQIALKDPAAALRMWRDGLQSNGFVVLQMRLMWGVLRGFSLPNDRMVPTVCISSTDAPAGRLFTLLHEVGHLVLRRNGICNVGPITGRTKVEAWTNRFSAAVLMPPEEFKTQWGDIGPTSGIIADESHLSRIAGRFNVSPYAASIRLKELGLAELTEDQQLLMLRRDRAARSRKVFAKGDEFIRERSETERFREWGWGAVGVVLDSARQGLVDLGTACNMLELDGDRLPLIDQSLSEVREAAANA